MNPCRDDADEIRRMLAAEVQSECLRPAPQSRTDEELCRDGREAALRERVKRLEDRMLRFEVKLNKLLQTNASINRVNNGNGHV